MLSVRNDNEQRKSTGKSVVRQPLQMKCSDPVQNVLLNMQSLRTCNRIVLNKILEESKKDEDHYCIFVDINYKTLLREICLVTVLTLLI